MPKKAIKRALIEKFPDIFGFTLKEEKKENITIKGIDLIIRRYKTTEGEGGIRLSLLENSGIFFMRIQEFLAGSEKFRTQEEKALMMYSWTTFTLFERGLQAEEGVGFYVYKGFLIFNEEEKGKQPEERLRDFVIFFKKKYKIRTALKDNSFEILDELEI